MNLFEKIYTDAFGDELEKVAGNISPVIKDLATQRYLAKRMTGKIGNKPTTTTTMKTFLEANKPKKPAGVAGYYTRGEGAI
jgi:poly-gamma-glutamate capsule biosynthesis protein CapA/YwtB (metallophosphatase superfamily)